MSRKFEEWLETLKVTIADWKYYTDFGKVYRNTEKYKIELNLLNSLINSKDIKSDFVELVKKYPEVLRAIPILIAKRESEIFIIDKGNERLYNFNKLNYSIDDYIMFMEKTGLFNLLENHIISDLNDYVKGVEVGLDTNARKNRTGKAMENIVEEFIMDSGFLENSTYFKQMSKSKIETKFGIKLTEITNENKKAEKVFDFVIKTDTNIYAIETNFYSGGGSKLNETARSYELMAKEAQEIENFEFIWITDGIGWLTAKNNLNQTFDVHSHVYNINDLENGILKKVCK